MGNEATSVGITHDANKILSALSTKLGQSNAEVIEIALKELEERIFWSEVSAAFDRIAADPAETALQKAEVRLWDQGTARDYEGEEW